MEIVADAHNDPSARGTSDDWIEITDYETSAVDADLVF